MAKKKYIMRALSVGLSLALCAGMVAPAFAANFTDLQNAFDGVNGTAIDFDIELEETEEHEDGTTTIKTATKTVSGYGYGWNEEDALWGIKAWDDEKSGSRNIRLDDSVKYENDIDGPNAQDYCYDGITIKEGADVVLDLNGKTIDLKMDSPNKYCNSSYIAVEDAKLTLRDTGGHQETVKAEDGTEREQYVGGKITGANAGMCTVLNIGTFLMEGGSITGNEGMYGGGVMNMGIFIMEGGAISENTCSVEASAGAGVYNRGKFEMYGGMISGNRLYTSGNWGGAGVYNEGGTFDMYGGSISENQALLYEGAQWTVVAGGGGVENAGGTFNMYGGEIKGNVSAGEIGGGVLNRGRFNMSGGEIIGNTSYDEKGSLGEGGGVGNGSSGTFVMSGGTIKGNTADHSGGGVSNYGTFTMTGGVITGNSAGMFGGGVGNLGSRFGKDTVVTMTGGAIYGNEAKLAGDDFASVSKVADSDGNAQGRVTDLSKVVSGCILSDGSQVVGWYYDGAPEIIQDESGEYQYGSGVSSPRYDPENPEQLTEIDPEYRGWIFLKVAHGHTPEYTMEITKQPTCTEEGEATFTCTCGDSYTGVIPVDPDNHVGETELRGAKEATYEEEGYTGDIHCADCGALIQPGEVIPMLVRPTTPVIGGGATVEIDEVAVPLAGLFTRADAIGYLWEQAGSPEWELSDFPDVPADHHWAVAIGWAQDMGIALPDRDGNFRPDDLVLRSVEDIKLSPEGELEQFLNRYAVYAGIELEPGKLFIALDGEWDEIIMGEDAQIIFDHFFAKLEAALAGQAA